jgi:hypothetical protein
MSHWQLFSNSFGKLLHPVLWVYGLVVVLGSSAPAMVLLFNNSLVNALVSQQPQAVRSTLISMGSIMLILGVIGFVFATFGSAALMHLINKLEMREHITIGMGLDGSEKIFQLLVVRVLLMLPNLLIVILAVALLWNQIAQINPISRVNPLSDLMGGFCGILLIGLLVGLVTAALAVVAERAIVLEKMSIGQALGLSGQVLAAQLGDFIIIGLIFLGLSILIGILFSCVGQPLMGLMFSTASPAALRSGSLLSSPILLLTISFGLIENLLATIMVTSVWTLAYRRWRSERLPASLQNEFA